MAQEIIPEISGIGVRLAKAQIVFAWALHRWCAAHENTYLDAIAFDKLCGCTLRICDALANAGVLSFRMPYRLRRGLHGRGPALQGPDDAPVQYVGAIIRYTDSELPAVQKHFEVSVKKSNETRDAPRYELLQFRSGVIDSVVDEWKKDREFLDRDEAFLLDAWTNLLGSLSHTEVRALGTHANAREALEDLAFEFRGCVVELNRAFTTSPSAAHDKIIKAQRYSDEMIRKGQSNRTEYGSAYNKIVSSLVASTLHEDLYAAFKTEYSPPEKIWENEGVKAWLAVGKAMSALVDYTVCVAAFHASQTTAPRDIPRSSSVDKLRRSYRDVCGAYKPASQILGPLQLNGTESWEAFCRNAMDVTNGIYRDMCPSAGQLV